MEYNNLLELIKTVSESNISGFQYENGDTRIVIATGDNSLPVQGGESRKIMVATDIQKSETMEKEPSAVQTSVDTKKEIGGNIVKSPLVGTFYAAPAEDAEAFVQIGDRVKKGQTLAIVEAMKLMNDIESEYEGVIREVFVKNGDMVEYGQPLFSIA